MKKKIKCFIVGVGLSLTLVACSRGSSTPTSSHLNSSNNLSAHPLDGVWKLADFECNGLSVLPKDYATEFLTIKNSEGTSVLTDEDCNISSTVALTFPAVGQFNIKNTSANVYSPIACKAVDAEDFDPDAKGDLFSYTLSGDTLKATSMDDLDGCTEYSSTGPITFVWIKN